MALLEVKHLSQMYGDKILYQDAGFDLFKGEHMGVVGQNGAGKSTLIGVLTGEVVPDGGSVRWQPDVRLGYLDQYARIDEELGVLDYLKTAFQSLYALEEELRALYDSYAAWGDAALLEQAAEGQARLEAADFYAADTRVDKVVEGLGLRALGLDRPLGRLSGGQRAKVILAKLLLERPDVLLLDEPTNFLDKEHVEWLAEYLRGFENAFVVVSHDHAFLNRVCTCICDVEARSIRKYHGGYEDFLRQKEHLRADHIRRYNAQQQEIQRTEAYIRKNIAGVNSKNAKGRRKQLENLERIAPPAFTAKPNIRFPACPAVPDRALWVEELLVGYDYSLLPSLSFTVSGGEKLVITGFNGIGKSTLLKTLVGRLPRRGGAYRFARQSRVGYYEQELHWPGGALTPIQIIAGDYPNMTEKQIRRALSGCGVKQDSVLQPISTLSGGEQSKVKLCALLLTPSNFLILDEPTNHLDADTKEELHRALERFEGAVILVSHEASFYHGLADRVLDIGAAAR